jgi:hypothetical protein
MMAFGNQSITFLHYMAYFLAGALLANGVPHFVKGICGEKFETPIALWRGEKQSAPWINVAWGWVNFAIGAALLHYFTPVRIPAPIEPCITASLGALASAVYLAQKFGKPLKTKRSRK